MLNVIMLLRTNASQHDYNREKVRFTTDPRPLNPLSFAGSAASTGVPQQSAVQQQEPAQRADAVPAVASASAAVTSSKIDFDIVIHEWTKKYAVSENIMIHACAIMLDVICWGAENGIGYSLQ
jgi:hypothetical protein